MDYICAGNKINITLCTINSKSCWQW